MVGDEVPCITSISLHEVLTGCQEDQRTQLEKITKKCIIAEHDATAAIIGSEIETRLMKEGKLIGRVDILIAAICQSRDATLVTCDKDFQKIKTLKTVIVQ